MNTTPPGSRAPGGASAAALERTTQFSALLQQGPLEFLLGAKVSPSMRALRYSQDDEELAVVDLVLATFYKYVSLKTPSSERPHELLEDVIADACPHSLLWCEAHSVLGVYCADSDDLARAMPHFRCAVEGYAARGRDDGLAVTFVRHARAMAEHGAEREARQSLWRAEAHLAGVERELYRHYVQLVRAQCLCLDGQMQAAVSAVAELRGGAALHPDLDPVARSLEYAAAVDAGDDERAETLWQGLHDSGDELAPLDLIASRARLRSLLAADRFEAAAEWLRQHLQGAPLAANRGKRRLIDELLRGRSPASMPAPLSALFAALLSSVDTESQQSAKSGLNLYLSLREEG